MNVCHFAVLSPPKQFWELAVASLGQTFDFHIEVKYNDFNIVFNFLEFKIEVMRSE